MASRPSPPAHAVGGRHAVAVVALAAASPVVFLLGVLLAEAAQPPGSYDAVGQTVSTLAGRGAADRWIMTAALATMGALYVLVAAGLRGVPRLARLVLGLGGAAAVVAALAAQPVRGSSAVHMAAAVTAVLALTLWALPLAADRSLDPGLRRGSLVAAGVMAAGLAWLCAQAWSDGTWLGAAERVLILAQTVWPIRVALVAWRGPTPARWDAGWTTLVLAVLAPLVLVGGFGAAQAAWPGPDAWSQSLSALAGLAAPSRWIMTLTLVVAAVLHVFVAVGLRHRVPTPAWTLLGAGAVLLVITGLNPQPAGGYSAVHMVAGGLAWAAYSAWPLGLVGCPAVEPRLRRDSAIATAVLAVLVAWFAYQLVTSGPWYGPTQRVVLLAQAVWPIRVAAAVVGDRVRSRAISG